MSASESTDDIAAFIAAIYGDTIGLAHWAIGVGGYFNGTGSYKFTDWIPQREFAYPNMSGGPYREILDAAAESDVYVNPYLMASGKRTKANAVNLALLHEDWDGDKSDLADCLAKASTIGGCATMSGTDAHLHIYVPLAQPVTERHHADLLAALAAYLPPGCDKGKKAASDMLRPVGTRNHKGRARGGESTAVVWAIPPTGKPVEPGVLAEVLRVIPTGQQPAGATNTPQPGEPHDGKLPEAVQAALDEVTGDRSEDTSRVVGACYDAGLTLAQTEAAVGSRADLAERVAEFAARKPPVDDVEVMWLKAIEARQPRRREQVEMDEFLAPYSKARAQPKTGNAIRSGLQAAQVGPKVWKASDLKGTSQPKFLGSNRIPFGAVTILCGDEGIGKSLFWVWIVAAITTGKPLPEFGVPERDPVNVMLVLTEDDWRTCVLPRLIVAGADQARVQVICTDDDGSGSPLFPTDMDLIIGADPKPALVVVDAWLDTVPSRMSVRDPQQARYALHPWKDAAGKTGSAIVLVTHANRLETTNMRDKYGASASLRQKARMTLYALADAHDGSLLIGPDKANGASGRTKATRFQIVADQYFEPTADHDGTVPRMQFMQQSDKTIRDHLAEMSDEEQRKSRRRTAAETWLIQFLANGPRKSVEVYVEGAASEHEFSRDQLKTAKAKVCGKGIKTTEADRTVCWWWELLPEYAVCSTALDASAKLPMPEILPAGITPEIWATLSPEAQRALGAGKQ